jgi:hypothetical protein
MDLMYGCTALIGFNVRMQGTDPSRMKQLTEELDRIIVFFFYSKNNKQITTKMIKTEIKE